MTSPSVLYAFATPVELYSVFPEFKDVADKLGFGKAITLPANLGYASILGIGLVDFSANLTSVLLQAEREGHPFSEVVILGVCGAYEGRGINVLDVVRVDSEIVGDLGYQEKDGTFCPFPCSFLATSPEKAPEHFRDLKSVVGLSVNRCTGTEELGRQRSSMFNADIENMEGAAGFSVCRSFCVPVFEIRAVCNMASTRDRESWKFFEALSVLRQAVFVP